MITQEMVEALQSVPLNISSTRRGGENGLRNAEEVLAVVYPLIIEQAAGICDNWRKIKREDNVFYENAGDRETAVVCLVQASMAASCATSIRNLKDKTDE